MKIPIILSIFSFAFLINESDANSTNVSKDATSKISPRIVGGQKAYPDQYPHQATIARRVSYFGQYDYQQICGAAVINERWLITAAHCLPYLQHPLIKRQFVGIIGSHDLQDNRRRQVIEFEKAIVHPNYFGAKSHANDIGLIKTIKPITESASVKFAQLPKSGERFTGVGVATGHGKTSTRGGESDYLLHVDIEIRSDYTCSSAYGSVFNSKAMICAGGRVRGKATCMGDSGGPFVQEKDGKWTLVGLTSFGPRECAAPGVPVVFTKVSSYVNWITDTIKKN